MIYRATWDFSDPSSSNRKVKRKELSLAPSISFIPTSLGSIPQRQTLGGQVFFPKCHPNVDSNSEMTGWFLMPGCFYLFAFHSSTYFPSNLFHCSCKLEIYQVILIAEYFFPSSFTPNSLVSTKNTITEQRWFTSFLNVKNFSLSSPSLLYSLTTKDLAQLFYDTTL